MDYDHLIFICISAVLGALLVFFYRCQGINPTRDHEKPITYRLRGISLDWDHELLHKELVSYYKIEAEDVSVRSFATEVDGRSKTATIQFSRSPNKLKGLHKYEPFQMSKNMHIDRGFLGLTTISMPRSEDHAVDIVALSGLGGHAFGSFKAKSTDHMWLRDSLPSRLTTSKYGAPMARVLIYGYASDVLDSNNAQNLGDLASKLRNSLARVSSSSRKPLILIGHSLGGLVIKEALIFLHESLDKDCQQLLRSVYGLAFFGVPHLGMEIGFLRAMARDNLNRGLIESLSDQNSPVLVNHQRKFQGVLDYKSRSRIESIYFYESEGTPTYVEVNGVWKPIGPVQLLVKPLSGAPDRASDSSWNLTGNHSNLVKFHSEHDESFTIAASEICSLAQKVVRSHTAIELEETEMKISMLKAQATLARQAYLKPLHFDGIRGPRKNLQHEDGTCQWLLQHDAFVDWKNNFARPSGEQLRILRLEGKPGCGKSVLMKAVESHCREVDSSPTLVTLSFFFDARFSNDLLQTSASGVYRSLLSQLLDKFEPASLLCLDKGFEGTWKDMTEKHLQNAILQLFRKLQPKSTLVFLDALDECLSTEFYGILIFLGNKLSTEFKIGLCFSACNASDFDVPFEGPTSTIRVDVNNKADIDCFINKKLEALKHQKPDLCKRIIPKLSLRASNIFLWADCVIRELIIPLTTRRGRSDKQIEALVNQLPADLLKLYQYLLRRIMPSDRMEASCLFLFVQASMRPLTGSEVKSILEASTHEELDVDTKLEDRIRLLSCGLIECRASLGSPDHSSEQSDYGAITVQYIHKSVGEFILSNIGLPTLDPEFAKHTEAQMHLRASTICMQVLDSGTQHTLKKKPDLLPYAAQFWMTHSRKGGSVIPDNFNCPNFVEQCGGQSTDVAKLFRKHTDSAPTTNYILKEDIPDSRILRGSSSLLVTLAFEGCTKLAARHLDSCRLCHSQNLISPSIINAAFFFAAERGHLETVKCVTSHPKYSVDVNSTHEGTTALYTACFKGKRDIVQFLLSHGADLLISGGEPFQLPFHAAVFQGNTEVVEAIIQQQYWEGSLEVLLCSQDERGLTAIHAAVYAGHHQILEKLLTSAQDMVGILDQRTRKGKTAWDLAVFLREQNSGRRGISAEDYDRAAQMLERYGGNVLSAQRAVQMP